MKKLQLLNLLSIIKFLLSLSNIYKVDENLKIWCISHIPEVDKEKAWNFETFYYTRSFVENCCQMPKEIKIYFSEMFIRNSKIITLFFYIIQQHFPIPLDKLEDKLSKLMFFE